jgi:hypothetical protein
MSLTELLDPVPGLIAIGASWFQDGEIVPKPSFSYTKNIMVQRDSRLILEPIFSPTFPEPLRYSMDPVLNFHGHASVDPVSGKVTIKGQGCSKGVFRVHGTSPIKVSITE